MKYGYSKTNVQHVPQSYVVGYIRVKVKKYVERM